MNQTEEYRAVSQSIAGGFGRSLELVALGSREWEFQVPHGDQHGDPLWFAVCLNKRELTISDGGAVAGLLFSLDQDEEGTAGFELLQSLAKRHRIELDYDGGLLQRTCLLEETKDMLPSFTRVVLSLLTTIPHLESVTSASHEIARANQEFVRETGPATRSVTASRFAAGVLSGDMSMAPPRFGGDKVDRRRLKTRIMDAYRETQLSRFIKRKGVILGDTGARWPIDFQWKPRGPDRSVQEVIVLAEDLRVKNPLPKAHKVSSLAIDTRASREEDLRVLRVVIDTGHQRESTTLEASNLIQSHKRELGYEVYDFADTGEYAAFLEKAGQELLLARDLELPVRTH